MAPAAVATVMAIRTDATTLLTTALLMADPLHDSDRWNGVPANEVSPGPINNGVSSPMLENPLRLLARLPAPVRLLVTGTLINKAGTFIVPFLTIVLLREFRLSETEAAELLFAYGAGSIVSILAGGFLTDRLGRRRTLMISLFGSGALAVAMGFAPAARVFV